MPDLGLIEGCDFYFVDAVDVEEGMCNETTSTCGRPFPLAAMSSDQSGRFQPSQSHTARPMTSWRSRPLSQGISSVNIVTHSFHEHGTRVMSVKLCDRLRPSSSGHPRGYPPRYLRRRPAGRHRVAKTYRNSRLTASAIEDYHIRPKVGEEAGVNVRAAGVDRGLDLASLRFFHCNPISEG